MKTREEIIAKIYELLSCNKEAMKMSSSYRALVESYIYALLWVIGETQYCETCLRVDCKCSPD